MTKVIITIREIAEMIELSSMPLKSIVSSYYIDDNTIVHCKDNNTDYPLKTASLLIAYIEEQLKIK